MLVWMLQSASIGSVHHLMTTLACLQVQQPEYRPGQPTWLQLQSQEDATLVFESRFESGNLRRAVQVRSTPARRSGPWHACTSVLHPSRST